MATVPSLDAEDRLIGSFSGRQVALAAVGAAAALGLFWALRGLSPFLALPVAAIVGGAGAALALMPPFDGLRHEAIPVMAAVDILAPRRQVLGEVLPLPRRLTGWRIRERIGRLRFPWRTVTVDGDLDLGRLGLVRIHAVTSLDFDLLTPEEQAARVESYAKMLNALDHPVQIVVRAEPVPLACPPQTVPSALSTFAADHAVLLQSYAARPRRRTYVVARAPDRPRLDAHSDEIASALAGMGLRARRLDRGAVENLIGKAAGG